MVATCELTDVSPGAPGVATRLDMRSWARRDLSGQERQMSVSPEPIESKTSAVTRRGYAVEEVTTFLSELAQDLRSEDDFRRAGSEVSAALRELQESVTKIRSGAEKDAERRRSEADAAAETATKSADEEARELRSRAVADVARIHEEAEEKMKGRRVAADRDRAAARESLKSAERDAAAIVAVAKTDASKMLSTAEVTAREGLQDLLDRARADLQTLESARTAATQGLRDIHATVGVALSGQEEAELIDLSKAAEEPQLVAEGALLLDHAVAAAVSRGPDSAQTTGTDAAPTKEPGGAGTGGTTPLLPRSRAALGPVGRTPLLPSRLAPRQTGRGLLGATVDDSGRGSGRWCAAGCPVRESGNASSGFSRMPSAGPAAPLDGRGFGGRRPPVGCDSGSST